MKQQTATKKLKDLLEEQTSYKLEQQYSKERVVIDSKSKGFIGNFFIIAVNKTYELLLNIVGDYKYQSKNDFSIRQKRKILDYLQVKVFTVTAQMQQKQKIKFADYDPHFMDTIPEDLQQLRYKIMKGNTNLEAARESLERLMNSKQQLMARYLNEQAYEFDRTKYNSIGWGLLFGAFINATLYRRGNTIRKAALILASGHILGLVSYFSNIDRYLDSVYPIFQQSAIKFSLQQKQIYQDWKQEGKAVIQG